MTATKITPGLITSVAGVAGGGAWNLIGTVVANNSATVTFTGLGTTYAAYGLICSDMIPSSAGTGIVLRVGDSSGIDSGTSDYGYHCGKSGSNSASYSAQAHATRAHIHMALSVNTGAYGASISGFLTGGFNAGDFFYAHGTSAVRDTGADIRGGQWLGARLAVITVDRVQVLCETGNITSGRVSLWGIANA